MLKNLSPSGEGGSPQQGLQGQGQGQGGIPQAVPVFMTEQQGGSGPVQGQGMPVGMAFAGAMGGGGISWAQGN